MYMCLWVEGWVVGKYYQLMNRLYDNVGTLVVRSFKLHHSFLLIAEGLTIHEFCKNMTSFLQQH